MVPDQQFKLFTDPSCAYLGFRTIFDFGLNHGSSSDSDSSIQVHCTAQVNKIRHITSLGASF